MSGLLYALQEPAVAGPEHRRGGQDGAFSAKPVDEIDFWDLDMFTDGDPHLAWSLLRREAPVRLHDRDGTAPFWCLTRYEDVQLLAPSIPML